MTEKELATITATLDVFAAQANEVANSPASAAGPAAVVIGKNWLQDLSKQLSKSATALREGLMSDDPVEMPKEKKRPQTPPANVADAECLLSDVVRLLGYMPCDVIDPIHNKPIVDSAALQEARRYADGYHKRLRIEAEDEA